MIASEIVALNDDLNINTVQNVLRSLLKEGYIEVAEIVYSGTVLCRSYQATEKAQDASIRNFADHFQRLRKIVPVPKIFSALMSNDDVDLELISELEQLLKDQRQVIENQGN